MKIIIILFVVSSISLIGGKYGEHKFIGDRAFDKAVKELQIQDLFLFDSSSNFSIFELKNGNYIFSPFKVTNGKELNITYGMLTGLSADHASTPTRLIDGLFTPYSQLIESLQEHKKSINDLKSSAEDDILLDIDFDYAWLAIEDLSHFYDASKTLDEHYEMERSNFELIKEITDFNKIRNRDSLLSVLFENLENVNLVQKYIYLHTMALEFGIQSNKTNSPAIKKNLIFYSFLLNSFADHFIQDAFSAGHLPVKRSVKNSLINREAHNYFCKLGIEVINQNGDVWTSYGDNYMNKNHFTLNDVDKVYKEVNNNLKLAIEADNFSVSDLLNIYKNNITKSNVDQLIDSLKFTFEKTDLNKNRQYLSKMYKALKVIPIPLYTPEEEIIDLLDTNDSRFKATFIKNYSNFSHNEVHRFFSMFNFSLALGANYYTPFIDDKFPIDGSFHLKFEATPFNLYNPTSHNSKNSYINSQSLWLGFISGIAMHINMLESSDLGFKVHDPRRQLELGTFLRLNPSGGYNIIPNSLIQSIRLSFSFVKDTQAQDRYDYLSSSFGLTSSRGDRLEIGYNFNLNRSATYNYLSIQFIYPIFRM